MSALENKGIVNLINKSFRNSIVDEFKNNPVTFVIGKFNAESSESIRSDVARQSFGGAVVGKTISGEDAFSLIAPRIDWTRGQSYNAYSPQAENTRHYVLSTDDQGVSSVYLCIENGDTYTKGLKSTIQPQGDFGKILSFDDGYKWIRLYNITDGFHKFLTSAHIPVPSLDDINNSNSTSSLRLSLETLNYWFTNAGQILRFDVEEEVKDLRWTSKPTFTITQVPANPASVEFVFENDTTNVISTRRGWALKDIKVNKSGSGYTQQNNFIIAGTSGVTSDAPTYSPLGIGLDHLFGTSRITSINKTGPFIKPVLSLGALDIPTLLGSDRAMFVADISANEIIQNTSVTTFDSVALVQNLKHTNGDNIETVVGKNTAFRMTDKIKFKTLSSSDIDEGDEVQSALKSGADSTRGLAGKAVSVDLTTREVEFTRGDHQIEVSDKLFAKSTTKNKSSTISSSIASNTSTLEEDKYVGSATDKFLVTVVDNGEGRIGSNTQTLYTNALGASDPITKSQGILFRVIIGGDGITSI